MKNNLQDLKAELLKISKTHTCKFEIITPDIARSFLLQNLSNDKVRNRTININAVRAYVRDILGDRWKVGAAIVFDSNNSMIDGQTRCTSIIKSDMGIISLVLRGVEPSTFDVFDSGKKRTHRDALSSLFVNGKKLNKPAGVGSGIGLQFSVNRNHRNIDKNRGMLTNTEIVEMVRKDFEFYDFPFSSGEIFAWRKSINNAVQENVFSGFYYNMKKNHDDVNDFLSLITSNDSKTPTIVRNFRDMVIENKGRRSDEKFYLSPKSIYVLIDALYTYSQSTKGLNVRKHFSKADLIKVYEK